MLDELADFLGLRERIAAITARAMNGEIDFAGALHRARRAAEGPAGRPGSTRRPSASATMAGGATLVATMHKYGGYCALVSGGFTYFTGMVRERARLRLRRRQHARARRPHARRHGRSRRSSARKPSSPRSTRLCAERGLALDQSIAVGDGANDLPMLQAAGLGVAFRAKPTVAAAGRRRASTTAISPRCSTCRATAGATSSRGKIHDRHPSRSCSPGVRRATSPPTASARRQRHPAGARRRPGADPLALPVARSLHAPAHDRAALLHAALRARQAADRRLGRRGRRSRATRASPRATP